MEEPIASTNESAGMSTFAKGALLLVGACVITIVVTVFIAVLAFMFVLVGSPDCRTIGHVLLVVWVALAAVFLTGVAVVGVVARRLVGQAPGCWLIVAVYGMLALANSVVFAFGLMILFNC